MNLQKYRFKFLTMSKNVAIVILVVGCIYAFRGIFDFNKARRIELMNGPEFRQLVDSYNYRRASMRSLKAVAKKALDITPQEIETSEQATLQILNKNKDCLDCHNRIVFFDLTKNDKLTATGLDALRSSYDLSPYGEIDLMKWRLEVSSKFWADLDEDLRKSSLTQITALAQFETGRYWLWSFDTDVESIQTRVARLAK